MNSSPLFGELFVFRVVRVLFAWSNGAHVVAVVDAHVLALIPGHFLHDIVQREQVEQPYSTEVSTAGTFGKLPLSQIGMVQPEQEQLSTSASCWDHVGADSATATRPRATIRRSMLL